MTELMYKVIIVLDHNRSLHDIEQMVDWCREQYGEMRQGLDTNKVWHCFFEDGRHMWTTFTFSFASEQDATSFETRWV